MKKCIKLLICLVLVLAMTGCANNGSASKPGSNQTLGVNDVLMQGMAEADSKDVANTGQPAENNTLSQSKAEQTANASSTENKTDGVDIDLTVLSSTMVYSEVYNMMVSPEDFIGKTVKMKGPFAYYHDEETGNDYFACIIQDATACCAQGIEFLLTEDYVYPDDYPEADEIICVVGVFDTYMEGNYTYCTLREAKLL